MDAFLAWLEKYDLLIELILTVLTISLSLLALFQTKNIAKQQANLQERQISISVYEQKNEINKALNVVFDSTNKISLVFSTLKAEKLSQDKLYQLLNGFLDNINCENISYTLEQSQIFLKGNVSANITKVRIAFLKITTNIECLDLLKEDENAKNAIINTLQHACDEIKSLQTLISNDMIEEMKLT